MATIISQAYTGNAYATNEKKVDMHPELLQGYVKATAPLIYLFEKIGKGKTTNSTFDWITAEEFPSYVQYTGANESGTPSDGNVTIALYSALKRDTILRNTRTGEVMRVSTTPTTSSVYLDRGIGGTTATAMYTGDRLEIMAPATEELASYSNASSVVDSRDYNYTQIFDAMIETARTVNAEATHFGSKRVQNQKAKWHEWYKGVEKTIMFGRRASFTDPNSGNVIRTTGGFMFFLENGTNVYTPSGGMLTESGFDQFLEDVFVSYPGGNKRFLICSPKIYGIISRFAKNRMVTSPMQKEYGMDLQRYVWCSVGIDIVAHPLLAGDDYLNGIAFLIDFDLAQFKWLRPPVMKFDCGVQSYNYIVDKIEAEGGLLLGVEKAHGLITGVTS